MVYFNQSDFVSGRSRNLAQHKKVFFCLLFLLSAFCIITEPAQGQVHLLQTGPMVGAADRTEVKLWVQTTSKATVIFSCYIASQPGKKWHSQPVQTKAEKAFAETVVIKELEPAEKYKYELQINGKRVHLPYDLTFYTLPDSAALPDVSFAAGSCSFGPPDTASSLLRIYPQIVKQKPEFMIWLGDNVYLGSNDWKTQEGYFKAYSYTRRYQQLQPLLGSVHHYAIWDDHDYGENNANKHWSYKEFAATAFRTFWPNPKYPEEGIYSTFTWADAQFFLLDCRWFRTSSRTGKRKRELLGEEQISWLLSELRKSKATFKFLCIGSQTLSTSGSSENYKQYGRELKQLIKKIEDAEIAGLLVLDGDRHFTELSKYERDDHYPLYGLTVSPLTSSVAGWKRNKNRVDGTLVRKHNFALLKITGEKDNRVLQMHIIDAGGNQLWQHQIHQNELKD